jgi:hypothetical protein
VRRSDSRARCCSRSRWPPSRPAATALPRQTHRRRRGDAGIQHTVRRQRHLRFSPDLFSGALTPPALVAETPNPSFLAVYPTGNFLYAANEVRELNQQPGGAVSAFAVDRKTGSLTPVNQQSTRGGGAVYLVVDKAGRNVLVANYGGGSAAVLPIEADGRLKPASAFVQHAAAGPAAEPPISHGRTRSISIPRIGSRRRRPGPRPGASIASGARLDRSVADPPFVPVAPARGRATGVPPQGRARDHEKHHGDRVQPGRGARADADSDDLTLAPGQGSRRVQHRGGAGAPVRQVPYGSNRGTTASSCHRRRSQATWENADQGNTPRDSDDPPAR